MNMIESEERTSLQQAITEQVGRYLEEMKGQEITNLYELVIEQVEAPLFSAVIEASKYNQSKAATTLGLSRGTLRTKLKHHFNDKYCGSRQY